MKGLFGDSIWDEMDEYWIYQQVQKEIEEENKDPMDDFDDDLLGDDWLEGDLHDDDLEDEYDVDDFEYTSSSAAVTAAIAAAEEEKKKVKKVTAKAVKKESDNPQPYRPQPTIVQAPREVVPQPPSAAERHGCGWLFVVFAILLFAWVGIDNYQGKQTSYDDYATTIPATSYTTTAYEPVTEVRSTTAFTTRYSMSRTKEDFYGVHDYVDAADFADEMAEEEFDGDWEEAYDYYEENY